MTWLDDLEQVIRTPTMFDPDEIVQYIIFRADLGMSKGKLVAQGGHGVLLAIREVERRDDAHEMSKTWLARWEASSYTKIALKVADLCELSTILEKLVRQGIVCAAVVDEGRTEVEPHTMTALALQPMPRSQVPSCVGSLKLL